MRKLRRMVAHRRMKKKGIHKINKDYGKGSYFANYWRDYLRK